MKNIDLRNYGIEKTDDGVYESRKFGASLKADDLGKVGSKHQAIILGVQERTFDEAEGMKMILSLDVPSLGESRDERSRQLTLNKTNLISLVSKLGEDTDAWVKEIITLKVEKTSYAGKTVPGIRIDA